MERESRGFRKHIRNQKAQYRSEAPRLSDEQKSQKAVKEENRFLEVTKSLKSDKGLSDLQKADLEVELLWWNYKRGKIGQAELMSKIAGIENRGEEVKRHLYEQVGQGINKISGRPYAITRLRQIKSSVIPDEFS